MKYYEADDRDERHGVAPYMGAWIEMILPEPIKHLNWSLPTWERGLKSGNGTIRPARALSLPTWERGLKSGRRGRQPLVVAGRSLHGSVD